MFRTISKVRHFSSAKRNFTGGKIIFNKAPSTPSGPSIPNVPGLSENCVKVPKEPVGPGKSLMYHLGILLIQYFRGQQNFKLPKS